MSNGSKTTDSNTNSALNSSQSKNKKPHSQGPSDTKKTMSIKSTISKGKFDTDDDFYISPLLIIGLFTAALGVGFLIPGTGGFNAPAWQTWSVIIGGLGVTVPGIIHTYKKNKDNKAKNKKSQ